MPFLAIQSYDGAERMLSMTVGAKFQHVISINDPETPPPRRLGHHPGRHLILHFHDVTRPAEHGLTPPSSEDVRRILEFARDIADDHDVLVHCAAGISRSSAAGLAVLAATSPLEPGPAAAKSLLRELLDAKKHIHPNRDMVLDIDRQLGFDGSLLEAYGKIWGNGSLIWMPPDLDELEPEDIE